jgi:hypothetical protein
MNIKTKYKNGQIPTDALKKVDSGHFLEENASDSYMRMKADAIKQGININYISYGNILNNNANTSINLPLIKTFKKLNELGQNISYNDIIAEMNE